MIMIKNTKKNIQDRIFLGFIALLAVICTFVTAQYIWEKIAIRRLVCKISHGNYCVNVDLTKEERIKQALENPGINY